MSRRIFRQERDHSAVELAWRVHDVAAGSIGKADSKAGFAATLETAAVAAVVTLADTDMSTTERVFLWIAGGLLVLAVVLAVAVVLPILHNRRSKRAVAGDFLYFGAVRHYSPDALTDRLRADDPLAGLSAQTIVLSKLAWLKHRLLQLSLIAAVAGIAIGAVALLIAGGAR